MASPNHQICPTPNTPALVPSASLITLSYCCCPGARPCAHTPCCTVISKNGLQAAAGVACREGSPLPGHCSPARARQGDIGLKVLIETIFFLLLILCPGSRLGNRCCRCRCCCCRATAAAAPTARTAALFFKLLLLLLIAPAILLFHLRICVCSCCGRCLCCLMCRLHCRCLLLLLLWLLWLLLLLLRLLLLPGPCASVSSRSGRSSGRHRAAEGLVECVVQAAGLCWADAGTGLQLLGRSIEDGCHRAKPAGAAELGVGCRIQPGWWCGVAAGRAMAPATQGYSEPGHACTTAFHISANDTAAHPAAVNPPGSSRARAPVPQRLDICAVHAAHSGERGIDAGQIVGAQVFLEYLRWLVLVAAGCVGSRVWRA